MLDFKADVTPNDHTREEAANLRKWLIAQAALLLPLLFAGQLWILFQMLAILPGWFSISDKLVHSPKLLSIYFLSGVFGIVFISVDLLINISMLFSSPPVDDPAITPTAPVSTGVILISSVYLSIVVTVSYVAAHKAWKLIKAMHDLPLASQPLTFLPTEPSAYATRLFGGEEASGGPRAFIPFQGQGQRLAEV
eukprot:Blabericola_migrator_1__2607@NODE_1736_length_3900_cov_462_554396_g1122_i0_p2_GENE_NODE_1736_length_3900_cov_462_554396_g1122_i0NODE_1736_length_3900_cov_462_554396_g1122_i0_p2_ORF_typecomplete_len194_score28_32CbiQ/PF02361_16/1_3_NODE_1736_length_3900_cov_462_554396_g1122_i032583839